MGRLRPRKPIQWLILLLAVLFLLNVFWRTRDLPFPKYIPWFYPANSEEDLLVDKPRLCRIQDDNTTEAGDIVYNCLGRHPEKFPPPDKPNGGSPAHTPMPAHCIDAHFATGEPCSSPPAIAPKLDVVWIWANGSDPLFRSAIADAQDSQGTEGDKSKVGLKKGAKLYRDHDELKYSFRSVLQHFSDHTGKFHLVTTDVGDSTGYRYGILPQWLDTNITLPWTDGNVELNIAHHSQIFENLDNSTFNSFCIESQLHALTSVSKHFAYMNDDFFFTRDLTTTDFYSSSYGVVLRLLPGVGVPPVEWPTDAPAGEWQPLKYTSWLLSQRFGSRSRPYMAHVTKTLSPTILQEINHVWYDEFADTATHRFRGRRDVYTPFLHTHYIVERWRELLLWTWVIAKIGRDDNTWGQDDREKAWEELGGTEGFDTAYVSLKMRSTLEKERIRTHFEQSHEPVPLATKLIYSNMDGYPYALIYGSPGKWPETAIGIDGGTPRWKGRSWASCQIVRSKCFPEGSTATEIFHNLMFTHPESCGDCVIQALVTRSGPLGLSAFLPPQHRIHYANTKGRLVQDVDPESVPRLPLIKRPHEASYALRDVLSSWGTIRVRDWVVRAMERYRFVIGDTPSHFAMLSSPKNAQRFFQTIDNERNVALLTINDDVVMKEEEVDRMFRSFLDRRWGFPSAWEDVPPKDDVYLEPGV